MEKPSQCQRQRVTGFPCNKAYAAVEKYGFIWVWPGDIALSDESTLPELEWADHPEWGYGGGLFHIQCDYRLMIDNLMDLTHETYVHSSSIGQKEIDEALPVTKVDGDHVITERYMENVIAPPFWKMALRGNHLADDIPVDRGSAAIFMHQVMYILRWAWRMQVMADIMHLQTRKSRRLWSTLLRLKLKPRIGIFGEWHVTFSPKIMN